MSVLVVPRYGSGAGAGSIHFRRIKRLRASTYGRGIWEFWSDFQAAFSNNPLTVFVGQTAVFAGTLTGSNGYTSSVDLSCTAPTALACIVLPNKTTPTTSGVSITVTVTGPAGDYALNVAGTDPSGVAHNFPLTLHVVNFNLTPPAPSSIMVNRPNSSVPVSFQATAAGSFGAAVDLSCTGLPSGATCNFQPSSTIFPTSASPVPVTLTISTSTVTPSGAFPLTINGSTSGLNRTQNLSLTVTANADFTLVISSNQQSVTVRNTLGRGNIQRHAHGIQRLRQHGEPELWHGRAANLYTFASERHSNFGRSCFYRIRQQQPGAELQFRRRRPGHRFFGNPPFIQGDAQLNFRFQSHE